MEYSSFVIKALFFNDSSWTNSSSKLTEALSDILLLPICEKDYWSDKKSGLFWRLFESREEK